MAGTLTRGQLQRTVVPDASLVRAQTVQQLMASSLAPSPESPALPVPALAAEDAARLLEPPPLAPLALELPAVTGFDLNRLLGITAPCAVPPSAAPSSPPRRANPAEPLVLTHAPVKEDHEKAAHSSTKAPAGMFSAAQEQQFQRQVQQMRNSMVLQQPPQQPPPRPPQEQPATKPDDMAALQATLVPCSQAPEPAPEPAPEIKEQPEVKTTPLAATAAPAAPASTTAETKTETAEATPETPPETTEENEEIKSLPVDWDKMPLTVEPHAALDFGLGKGGLARVDEAVHATLTLSNPTGRAYSFRFVSRTNARYAARYSVASGTLRSAERVECTLTVVPLCTCVLASHEELVVWEGDRAAFARAQGERAPRVRPRGRALGAPRLGGARRRRRARAARAHAARRRLPRPLPRVPRRREDAHGAHARRARGPAPRAHRPRRAPLPLCRRLCRRRARPAPRRARHRALPARLARGPP